MSYLIIGILGLLAGMALRALFDRVRAQPRTEGVMRGPNYNPKPPGAVKPPPPPAPPPKRRTP